MTSTEKQERSLKTLDEIAANKAAIAEQYKNILPDKSLKLSTTTTGSKILTTFRLLRDVGKHASMTQMLDRDFVQNRIASGMKVLVTPSSVLFKATTSCTCIGRERQP